MDFQILYWHWLVFGMVLVLAEIFIPSFTIFWFGLAALLMGLLSFIGIHMDLTWSLFVWIVFSILFAFGWFKWIRPMAKDRTKAGLSREAVVGERGLITKAPTGQGERGEVRFSVPLLGTDTWPCLSQSPLRLGDTVMVKDVLGNALLVEPTVNRGAELK